MRNVINRRNERVEIACISFAFDNGEVIKLMQERARLLGKGKLKKILKVDNKINKLLESKYD